MTAHLDAFSWLVWVLMWLPGATVCTAWRGAR